MLFCSLAERVCQAELLIPFLSKCFFISSCLFSIIDISVSLISNNLSISTSSIMASFKRAPKSNLSRHFSFSMFSYSTFEMPIKLLISCIVKFRSILKFFSVPILYYFCPLLSIISIIKLYSSCFLLSGNALNFSAVIPRCANSFSKIDALLSIVSVESFSALPSK